MKMMKDIGGGVINTILGYSATIFITLEDVNLMLGIMVGVATTIYLVCKIIKVIKELKK
jgi:tellurite resistance protein TehA-like permease